MVHISTFWVSNYVIAIILSDILALMVSLPTNWIKANKILCKHCLYTVIGFINDQEDKDSQSHWWRVECPETAVCPSGEEERSKKRKLQCSVPYSSQ